jgi:hypothetical protein
MRKLQSLLSTRHKKLGFHHLNNRIRCYAHIINICSSHVIASMTSTHSSYLSSLRVLVGSNHVACHDSDEGSDVDESDGGSDDPGEGSDVDEIELPDSFKHREDSALGQWFAAIRRDPLRRARKVVSFLRSSPQRKEGLRNLIKEGNESNQFIGEDKGKLVVLKVPQLELLKDVRTRWDSVFLMLQRLRQLRPVSFSWRSDVRCLLNICNRPSTCISKGILRDMHTSTYRTRIGKS